MRRTERYTKRPVKTAAFKGGLEGMTSPCQTKSARPTHRQPTLQEYEASHGWLEQMYVRKRGIRTEQADPTSDRPVRQSLPTHIFPCRSAWPANADPNMVSRVGTWKRLNHGRWIKAVDSRTVFIVLSGLNNRTAPNLDVGLLSGKKLGFCFWTYSAECLLVCLCSFVIPVTMAR